MHLFWMCIVSNGYLCLYHIHVFYLEELRSLGPVAPLCFLLCICTNLRLLMALIVEKPMFRMSCGFFPIFWGQYRRREHVYGCSSAFGVFFFVNLEAFLVVYSVWL